jgi:hypothetical protein
MRMSGRERISALGPGCAGQERWCGPWPRVGFSLTADAPLRLRRTDEMGQLWTHESQQSGITRSTRQHDRAA